MVAFYWEEISIEILRPSKEDKEEASGESSFQPGSSRWKTCDNCGEVRKRSVMKRGSCCEKVNLVLYSYNYCSRTCQKRHWHRTHKQERGAGELPV